MGTMPPQDLLKKWEREEITIEMAIGHILQHLAKIQTAIDAINITLYNLHGFLIKMYWKIGQNCGKLQG